MQKVVTITRRINPDFRPQTAILTALLEYVSLVKGNDCGHRIIPKWRSLVCSDNTELLECDNAYVDSPEPNTFTLSFRDLVTGYIHIFSAPVIDYGKIPLVFYYALEGICMRRQVDVCDYPLVIGNLVNHIASSNCEFIKCLNDDAVTWFIERLSIEVDNYIDLSNVLHRINR